MGRLVNSHKIECSVYADICVIQMHIILKHFNSFV